MINRDLAVVAFSPILGPCRVTRVCRRLPFLASFGSKSPSSP
ncbi:hypothetical protein SLEP1_g22748 [Rubroshorea leprosula]|uniref:Uncharacterized protein n=1 Tax=Rubroshorea leprosula TaxID=152421 RepID=A0AAV5JG92_9ROSI|nr:hypothetical protein SLEP1_g22748 [Rubroshorea leprosula]